MKKILMVRIGWMKYYAGPQPDDKRPIGGGRYNKKNVGTEVFAFKNIGGWLHASFAFKSTKEGLNLERIYPNVKGDQVEDVKVIFFARDRSSGIKRQVVVGWYNHARIFRDFREHPVRHIGKTKVKDAVLLPTDRRAHIIPRGKNAPGQSNVFFIYRRRKSERKKLRWLENLENFIESYDGPNLLKNPEVEAEPEIEAARESAIVTSLGQGVIIDVNTRKVIEGRAMQVALKYFRRKHYEVENVSASRSYDLHCTKGKRELLVEVKGTQAQLGKITLTPNEVTIARSGKPMAIFIQHSIKVKKRGGKISARGGRSKVVIPWRIDPKRLKPVVYSYNII